MISSRTLATNHQVFHRLRAQAMLLLLALLVIFTVAAMSEGARAETRQAATAQQFQAALNAANPGDTIVLTAGVTYKGNFTLPPKGGSSYITITSSSLAQLPPEGQRVAPYYAQFMPRIVATNTNLPALQVLPGAHHYRIIGVEITLDQNDVVETLVELGSRYASEQGSDSLAPKYITLDRCYIHGLPAKELKRGVALNSAYSEIKNCYISEIHLIGEDSQAIMGWNGPGPFSIINNYLEAAGENLMFGGADPVIPNLVPSDIEIRRNHFYKPLEWRTGANWSEKNLLELKNAQRVAIEGNVLENSWTDSQIGYAIVFSPRNQGNTAPWSVVQDVQFLNNIVRHAGTGVRLIAQDSPNISQPMKRITFSNNLFDDINGPAWGDSHGWFLDLTGGVDNLTITHNTIFQTSSIINAGGNANYGFVFTNNVVPHNGFGIKGDGLGPGGITLNTFFPYAIFTGNLIPGANPEWPLYNYPGGNYYPDASTFDSQFVNRAAGDYRIAPTSPGHGGANDGKDVGADIVALKAATVGVDKRTPSTIGLSSNAYSFSEGTANISFTEGATGMTRYFGLVVVPVMRSGDTSLPAAVRYSTSDQSGDAECDQVTGYASQRCDYTLVNGTLRFAAGETVKNIYIPIVNDVYIEGTESFTIKLENYLGTNLGTKQATITILDDDTTTPTGSTNPYLSNPFFVNQLYADILGHYSEQSGFTDWTNVLNTCGPQHGFLGDPFSCDRAHVAHGFVASPEGTDRGYLIYRMYEVGMGRLPRYNELIPEMSGLGGMPESNELEQNTVQFIEEFSARQEFINNSDNLMATSQAEALIAKWEAKAGVTLPATITNTNPFQPPQYTRQQLIDKRRSGEFSVGQTLRTFVQQQVVYDKYFERGYVTMMYFGFLRRDPDFNDPTRHGWNDWVNVFTNGSGDVAPRDIHHLIFGFIYSDEYRKRFGAP
jgi:hypothetical protein